MSWCGDMDYGLFSLSQNYPSSGKGVSCCILPHSFLAFSQGTLGSGFFHSHIFFPTDSLYCGYLVAVLEKKCLTWTATHVQGKSHYLCSKQLGPEWQNCLPSESSRPTGFHSNCMMPNEPCSPTVNLWDIVVWLVRNSHTYTPRVGLLAPCAVFWRYVDT